MQVSTSWIFNQSSDSGKMNNPVDMMLVAQGGSVTVENGMNMRETCCSYHPEVSHWQLFVIIHCSLDVSLKSSSSPMLRGHLRTYTYYTTCYAYNTPLYTYHSFYFMNLHYARFRRVADLPWQLEQLPEDVLQQAPPQCHPSEATQRAQLQVPHGSPQVSRSRDPTRVSPIFLDCHGMQRNAWLWCSSSFLSHDCTGLLFPASL